jgi:HEAT repeat protein
MRKTIGLAVLMVGATFAQEAPTAAPPAPLPPSPAVKVELDLAEIQWKAQVEVHARMAEAQAGLQERMAEVQERVAEAQERAWTLAQARPMPGPRGKRRQSEDQLYFRGTRALDQREYEAALQLFDEVAKGAGERADGAIYWKAYALHKLGRRDEALAELSALQTKYPASRWLGDAKVLELDARQSSGQPVSPESASDEDLKLYAINALVHTEPERAVPMLERILNSSAAPKLKSRALFVLAQSRSPQALQIVTRLAKGGANPDLQRTAVEYLGIHGGKDAQATLTEIYNSSSDIAIRKAVLMGFMRTKNREGLINIANRETSPELKLEALRRLADMGATDEVWNAYRKTDSAETRREVVEILQGRTKAEPILSALSTEKDAEVRRTFVRMLALTKDPGVTETLVKIYRTESDEKMKQAAADGLFIQKNAASLISLARGESDIEMKKVLVERLSQIRSKEATDYLMEILEK